ncbi:hypothetical protein PIB30_109658, partial [Stylosanthes scabra]|nr:hypothetical protein [Stylosanthes scabra]
MHCFFLCSKALRVWQHFGFYPPSNCDLRASLSWIRLQCCKNIYLFCAIIWWVWRDRNNDTFSPSEPWRLEKVIALCRHSSHEFEFFASASRSTIPAALRLEWTPPHANCVKVNCDGSFFIQ